jgi:misacylated tRNA(Ala) deacylase
MTENLAAVDAYLRECDGRVIAIDDGGVVLDRTVFYARGGGQPGDTGSLTWGGGSATVIDTYYKDGAHFHLLEGSPPSVGTDVHGEIDWERRYTLMRTHTALHVLSAIIFRDFDAKVTGGNMEPGAARMDFELDSISVSFGEQVEAVLNEELAKNHEISVRSVARHDALADPMLIRTKVNLVPESVDPIRIIEIGDIDRQADGGTHVANTSEVGRVRVVKTESKGKANKRIKIELASY